MAFQLACADTGDKTCPFVVRAETMEEALKLAGEHVKATHKVIVTPQMAEQMRRAMKRV
ncbi:MAG: DUF1059 domain-containing protein [Chloroflexi bacterium]|nr:DUF1059 domain-containing protein [Chloroflexota bacterium]